MTDSFHPFASIFSAWHVPGQTEIGIFRFPVSSGLGEPAAPWSGLMIRLMFILVFMATLFSASEAGAHKIRQPREAAMENRIADIAERFIGIPYRFGADPDVTGAADNSHLICRIYEEAAAYAGLRFAGYMPMRSLLSNVFKIRQEEVRNGDLMVLNDYHAAMIYRVEDAGGPTLHLIYASLKRREIVSFNSRNIVFDAFWMDNLRGFYRLSRRLFQPEE